jgi:hypothetical protein
VLVAALPLSGAAPPPAAGPPPAHAATAVVVRALVARGAASDATASNNEVKLVRLRGLVAAVYAGGTGAPEILLAASRDGGAHWGPLGRVSEGAIASRLAALAADAAGNLHVVWTRYDDGVGKVYYRERAGRWAGPQRRISPGAAYAGYPAVALDRARRPHVLWYGIRAGTPPAPTKHGSIYEILYTGYDGRAWSTPAVISTGPPDAINPAMTADGAGRLHAVWYQYSGRFYQLRYDVYDGGWRAPEGIAGASSDQFNPDIAVDAAGRAAVVWEQHDGKGSVIDFARLTRPAPPAGSRLPPAAPGGGGPVWSEPVTISLPSAAPPNSSGTGRPGAPVPAYHPSISADATGTIWTAWDADDGQIYARRYKNGWGPILRLTGDGGNVFPSVLADGGALDIIWTHAGSAGASVYFARVTARP